MSEHLPTRRPEGLGDPNKIEWARLLEQALTMPGALGATYSRFYQYSFGNQIALWMQGVTEPVNTYNRWRDMNRQVKKGSKAKAILRPIMFKSTNELGEEERKVRGFKWVHCLFELSETEGEDLPPYEPPTWSTERALGTLGIQQVAFDATHVPDNTQGYSLGTEIAISPVAAYPFKTLIHELGHVTLGHTSDEGIEDYRSHRGLMEFGAEGTAYLVLNELEAHDQMDAAESRLYIQQWLKDERPEDKAIRHVLTATDTILKAGRTRGEEGA
jgi:hypothetical protein